MTNEELLEAVKRENRKLLKEVKRLLRKSDVNYKPCTIHLNCSGGGYYCNDNGPKYETTPPQW